MGEKPLRAAAVEQALASGSDPAAAAEPVPEGTGPPNDALAIASEYRRHLAKVLTRRADRRRSS